MPDAGYDDLVMDHIKNARNYRVLNDADRRAVGANPLCGDDMVLYLKLAHGHIADVTFQCTCCGISMASASVMTEMVKGRRADEARALVRGWLRMLSSRSESSSDVISAGQLAILHTVERFPARMRCAVLPWATLESALDDGEQRSGTQAYTGSPTGQGEDHEPQ